MLDRTGGPAGSRTLVDLAIAQREHHAALEAQCRLRLEQALHQCGRVRRGADVRSIARDGEAILLLEGMALSSHVLHNGTQQHLAVAVAGDFLDLAGFIAGRSVIRNKALVDCEVATILRSDFDRLVRSYCTFAAQIQLELARNVRMAQEQLVSLGRRSAFVRLARLFCELGVRVGSNEDGSGVELPLTQTDLADLLGLSVVHTNRMLQELKRQGLAELSRGRLLVSDWESLRSAAGFEAETPRRAS